ncbi:MAG: hypothetical protein A2Y76_04980 [Planctomycetes bacterium RBG_13_60_9]|nr:MAG: hypothetical protein A2Y76_04980 [Planctomycetes bacterium RBG_13_60_9]
MRQPASISVFFPCYHEEGNVDRVVRSAVAVLDGLGADYEIIIVDDGSADRPGEIAAAMAGQDARVRVVHHPGNRGYGAALQSGFRAAAKELVFYTDGDGQFDLAEMPALLDLMPTGANPRVILRAFRELLKLRKQIVQGHDPQPIPVNAMEGLKR